jgi:hypothetical protein
VLLPARISRPREKTRLIARRQFGSSARKLRHKTRTCQAQLKLFTSSQIVVMSKPSQPGVSADVSTPNPEAERWLKAFRAFLHTAITAEGLDSGQERLAALPGPKMPDYCLALAELPENTLALELARPVLAMLGQIETVWGAGRRGKGNDRMIRKPRPGGSAFRNSLISPWP